MELSTSLKVDQNGIFKVSLWDLDIRLMLGPGITNSAPRDKDKNSGVDYMSIYIFPFQGSYSSQEQIPQTFPNIFVIFSCAKKVVLPKGG